MTTQRQFRIPSVKTIRERLQVSNEAAQQVYAKMELHHFIHGNSVNPSGVFGGYGVTRAMREINDILGMHGVETIPAGTGTKSPAIVYCNTGDTYGTTVMFVRGRFQIGCWGDIVERGNYA